MALSGDVSSTADASTWSSLGEPRGYKQVEEEEKKGKAMNRKGGAGRSRLEIYTLQYVQDVEGLCEAQHMLQPWGDPRSCQGPGVGGHLTQ